MKPKRSVASPAGGLGLNEKLEEGGVTWSESTAVREEAGSRQRAALLLTSAARSARDSSCGAVVALRTLRSNSPWSPRGVRVQTGGGAQALISGVEPYICSELSAPRSSAGATEPRVRRRMTYTKPNRKCPEFLTSLCFWFNVSRTISAQFSYYPGPHILTLNSDRFSPDSAKQQKNKDSLQTKLFLTCYCRVFSTFKT